MARAAGQDHLVPWLSSLRPASRADQPASRPYARSKLATPSSGWKSGPPGTRLTFRMDGLRSGSTRDAHRLLHLARARGRQDELVERLHQAYFTGQAPIVDHESLARLALGAELNRAT